MSWHHGLKTRHEQQKEPDYLKSKTFLKSSNFCWNTCKELLEKKPQFSEQPSGSVLKEHCIAVSSLIGLQLC